MLVCIAFLILGGMAAHAACLGMNEASQ
jgi:hypothetical protein